MEDRNKFPQYEVLYWGGKIAGWDRDEDLVAFQSKHHSDEVRIGITRALGCSPNGAQYWIIHKADLEGALEALALWAVTTIPR